MTGSIPKISIVTPSFNQREYVEKTIQSVLSQGYPSTEYFVLDGGSTDGSVDVIKKYSKDLTYWVSEPDKGQADAIAKGFRRATGEILGYLNSDDCYRPGIFRRVSQIFIEHPEVEWVIGKSHVVDGSDDLMFEWNPPRINFYTLLFSGPFFHQPASFWRRSAYEAVGGFDTELRFAFDYDLYLRLAKRNRPYLVREVLASFRIHPTSKTSTLQDVCKLESERLKQKNGYARYPHVLSQLFDQMFQLYVRMLQPNSGARFIGGAFSETRVIENLKEFGQQAVGTEKEDK